MIKNYFFLLSRDGGKRRQTLVTAFGAFSPRSPEFGILTEKTRGKLAKFSG